METLSAELLRQCGILPESHILVAFSGGPDSTALLLLLKESRDAGLIGRLSAAHFNHRLRGKASDADEAFCADFCRKHGIDFYPGSGDVAGTAREEGVSLETAARRMRYAFLRETRERIGADTVATAHHADDQAETVLMHLLRGSGLRGLCGMSRRSGEIVRPLLGVRREELVRYLEACGQGYRTDETNGDVAFTRNRIRNELIPLCRSFQPDIVNKLTGLAAKAQADEAFLEGLAEEAAERLGSCGGIDRTRLREEPDALRKRLILRELRRSLEYDFTEADVNAVDRLLNLSSGRSACLSGGMTAWNDGDVLRIGAREERILTEEPLRIGESVTFGSWKVSAGPAEGYRRPRDAMEAYLSLDMFPGEELTVRTRRAGDRFMPLGMKESKLVSDVFTDRKTPDRMRNVPLVCAGAEILFIPGYTISEKARVAGESGSVVYISVREG